MSKNRQKCIINNIQLWALSRVDLRACFLLCVPSKLPVMDLLGSKTVRAGTVPVCSFCLCSQNVTWCQIYLFGILQSQYFYWVLYAGCLFLFSLFVTFKITVTSIHMSKHFFLMFSHPFLIHTNIGAYLELLQMSCNISSIIHQRKQ